MFEHSKLTGEKYRVVPAEQSFLQPEILEYREKGDDKSPRLQHAVAGTVLVDRYLPALAVGSRWPHDDLAEPWWNVVDHPPHAGIVADFNAANGGEYKRKLNPECNVVAFSDSGEQVVMQNGVYKMTRYSDGKEIAEPSLVALRRQYYAA